MRQLLLVLLGRIGRRVPHVLGSGLPLMSLALVVVGCASPSLMPEAQAVAIKHRDRALASHADAIHAAISQSGHVGALALLDAKDGRLVVLPGDSPADAWARYTASPESGAGRVSVPPVLTFVHRADVPKAPETVTQSVLQQQAQLLDAHRRVAERLDVVQREFAESKREVDASLAAARAEMQTALSSLAEDLTTVRKFVLQTAQLGWLNHEMAVENATGIRKVVTTSQELSASSAKLEETMRQLSASLAGQLKELANRLDTIQGKVSSFK
jgi:BMFP domain-containing protein YqiC